MCQSARSPNGSASSLRPPTIPGWSSTAGARAATAAPEPPTPSRAGYRTVQEMIGGFEYWAREGLAIETASGPNTPLHRRTHRPDERLT